jgi:hypothetical protein
MMELAKWFFSLPASDRNWVLGGLAVILVLALTGTIRLKNDVKLIHFLPIFFSWNSSKKKDLLRLLNHDFFINMAEGARGAFNLKITSRDKKAVIEAYYRLKCKIFLEGVSEFTKKVIDSGVFEVTDFLNLIYECISSYEEKSNSLPIALPGNRFLSGVPVSLRSGFHDFHTPHVELVVEKLKKVANSTWYSNTFDKYVICLEILDLGFKMTEIDLSAVANSMNGSLEAEISNLATV